MRRQLTARSTESEPNAVDRAPHRTPAPFTDSGPADGLATFSDCGYSGGPAPGAAMVQTAHAVGRDHIAAIGPAFDGAAARCVFLQ